MEWKEIKDVKDIENSLDLFGGFHDSCLKSYIYGLKVKLMKIYR